MSTMGVFLAGGRHGRFAAAVLCAAFAAGAACERSPKPAPQAAASTLPTRTYTVKGRVAQLPDAAVRGSMFQVAHEDIPDFADRDGKAVGMNAMTMPFPPAPGVSLDGLGVGDEIELTFEVRWDRIPPQQATVIRRLSRGG